MALPIPKSGRFPSNLTVETNKAAHPCADKAPAKQTRVSMGDQPDQNAMTLSPPPAPRIDAQELIPRQCLSFESLVRVRCGVLGGAMLWFLGQNLRVIQMLEGTYK
jgi:hypothetical protein